jgi:hypothetical protein
MVSRAGYFLACHSVVASNVPGPGPRRRGGREGERRIEALELTSSAASAEMVRFYRDSLGLLVLEERREAFTVAAGASKLTFRASQSISERPFYHFAFNVPENKILAARRWQKERTPLLPIPSHLRDPGYPDDVVNYRHWNSHSIFFFDPAGNVVEYIARHDLDNAAGGDFSSSDILYASEIGLVVDDVPAAAAQLKAVAELDQYRNASDRFTALGDERGLLLVMKRGRVISFDAPEKKAMSVFPTSVFLRGAAQRRHAFATYPYRIQVTGDTL